MVEIDKIFANVVDFSGFFIFLNKPMQPSAKPTRYKPRKGIEKIVKSKPVPA